MKIVQKLYLLDIKRNKLGANKSKRFFFSMNTLENLICPNGSVLHVIQELTTNIDTWGKIRR